MFANLPDRNNTSFPKELYETLKQIKLSKDDFLKYHQKIVVDYLMKYPLIRGLLAYHKMGSGKTILGVAICEILIKLFPERRVIFIANKSLHGNFRNTIKKYLLLDKQVPEDQIDAHIKNHYSFITMNASNMLKQVKAATRGEDLKEIMELETSDDILKLKEDQSITQDLNLDHSIVIMDEFHNLLNSISNGSKNAVGLYDAFMRAKDIKIIGLTGTPIVNDPYEIAIGYNIFAGPIHDPSKRGAKSYTTLFGEDYNDFLRMFIDNSAAMDPEVRVSVQRPRIKHRDKFCDRIMGLTSYYGAEKEEAAQFPTEYDIIVKRIPMSYKQYAGYINARDKELEENKRGFSSGKPMRLKKSSGSSSSSYRVRSRQISNFLYPTYASRSWRTETGQLKYEQFIDKLQPESLELPMLDELSPKLVNLFQNVSMHMPPGVLDQFRPDKTKMSKLIKKRTAQNAKKLKQRNLKTWAPGIGPGVVYSQFLDSGVNLIARILRQYGWDEFGSPDSSKPKYGIISGEVDPELRDQLVATFGADDNIDGSKLALLLITQTGAEGLDLKHGRHVHVLEPYWHWSRIRQIITRIVRLGSHLDLPEADQTVQPYIYLSDYPTLTNKDDRVQADLEMRMRQEETTDVTLYHKAMQNQMLIEDFLDAMRSASIDCMIHEGSDCRICSPTGKVLWHADLGIDIDEPSPCEPWRSTKVKTRSIVLDGVEYRYSDDGHMFEFNIGIQAWQEIFSDHPKFEAIIMFIKKSKKPIATKNKKS
jgi:hypothetical protein